MKKKTAPNERTKWKYGKECLPYEINSLNFGTFRWEKICNFITFWIECCKVYCIWFLYSFSITSFFAKPEITISLQCSVEFFFSWVQKIYFVYDAIFKIRCGYANNRVQLYPLRSMIIIFHASRIINLLIHLPN